MQLSFKKIGNGPALIILHGLYGNGDNWLPIAKFLHNNFTVYLPDMRNHGKSDHSDEFGYDVMAEDIYELIQEQNLEKVTLIGHSMGGRTAMRFAEQHGELLEKLIVIDISPITNQSKKRAQPMFNSHVDIVNALINIPVETISTRDEADAILAETLPFSEIRQFLLKNLKRDENQQFYWQINLSTIANAIEEIIVGTKTMNTAVECHTLFIKAEMSSYLTESDYDFLEMLFPNMEFKIVKGSGHWVHADKPEEFKKIISEFLSVTN